MPKVSLFVLMLLFVIPFGLAQAQDPQNPPPDEFTSRFNACFFGGPMEGKCDIPWEWKCGYYLAQWIRLGGWDNPLNFMPDDCASLLPPPLTSTVTEVPGLASAPAGCYTDGVQSFFWPGGTGPISVQGFEGPSCEIPGSILRMVIAPAKEEAIRMCGTDVGHFRDKVFYQGSEFFTCDNTD
jgi:hypothetical protein